MSKTSAVAIINHASCPLSMGSPYESEKEECPHIPEPAFPAWCARGFDRVTRRAPCYRHMSGVCGGDQARHRAQVLLAVATREHFIREHLVERQPGRADGQLGVVDPVDESDETQRLGLIGDLAHIAQADGVYALDEADVSRRMHVREMREELVESVVGDFAAGGRECGRVLVIG